MSITTYDSNDVIDLEHAFDEDRMSHYSSSTNRGFKSHRISLQSVDDDVIKSLTRSLITPLPRTGYPNEHHIEEDEEEEDDYRWNHHYYQQQQRYDRPESRTESVMLFKNIDNGNEPVTVDFVSSDLNEFMDPFADDDLMSRPPSRMPQKRRDSLNGFLKSSLLEKPSFAKPRSKERNNVQHSLLNDYRQTNKEMNRRLDPLHANSYTESVLQQQQQQQQQQLSSKKDNYQMESSMRNASLRSKASLNHMITSTKKLIEKEEQKEQQEQDVINRKKMLETRNNNSSNDPEKLRKRYSFNHVDHSIVPENRRRPINTNTVKESDKTTRRWSSYIPEKQQQQQLQEEVDIEADYKTFSNRATDNTNYKISPRLLSRQQQQKQQQQEMNRRSMDLNYPKFNSEVERQEEVDELWESQVTNDPPTPPSSKRTQQYHYQQQRSARMTSLHQNTTTTTTTPTINDKHNLIHTQRNRKYSNPTKYNTIATIVSSEKSTTTGIPKRTSSKLYELATQKKQQQQTLEKPNVIPTVLLSSRSSGELSNSTESSSNSGDLYYDPPSFPPPPASQNRDRVAFISNRTRELSIRENKEQPFNTRGYRARTLSEEGRGERMRNNHQVATRSKKLSLDSQKQVEKPSVAESARQVLEMVRQRRQQAMSSRTR